MKLSHKFLIALFITAVIAVLASCDSKPKIIPGHWSGQSVPGPLPSWTVDSVWMATAEKGPFLTQAKVFCPSCGGAVYYFVPWSTDNGITWEEWSEWDSGDGAGPKLFGSYAEAQAVAKTLTRRAALEQNLRFRVMQHLSDVRQRRYEDSLSHIGTQYTH